MFRFSLILLLLSLSILPFGAVEAKSEIPHPFIPYDSDRYEGDYEKVHRKLVELYASRIEYNENSPWEYNSVAVFQSKELTEFEVYYSGIKEGLSEAERKDNVEEALSVWEDLIHIDFVLITERNDPERYEALGSDNSFVEEVILETDEGIKVGTIDKNPNPYSSNQSTAWFPVIDSYGNPVITEETDYIKVWLVTSDSDERDYFKFNFKGL